MVLVAFGEAARREAAAAVQTVRGACELPVSVIAESRVARAAHVVCPYQPAVPLAKLHLDELSPYDPTLYLDADTRALKSPAPLLAAVADGFDMAITPSHRQGSDVLGHVGEDEREFTFEELGCRDVVNLQAGVFAFRKSPAMLALFAAWRAEWARYGVQDQAALLRALYHNPVRLWLFGFPFNGGEVVAHLFGRARR